MGIPGAPAGSSYRKLVLELGYPGTGPSRSHLNFLGPMRVTTFLFESAGTVTRGSPKRSPESAAGESDDRLPRAHRDSE
eukprot:984660-Rhodomonas_salina.1